MRPAWQRVVLGAVTLVTVAWPRPAGATPAFVRRYVLKKMSEKRNISTN